MNKKSASVVLDRVIKNYGSVTVIPDLTLTINSGELVTLLGPSGCGKTTTLRMIAGLEEASGGKIFINDEDVTDQSATYRNVAMVFQSYALFPHMNVFDNVSFGLSVSSMSKKQLKEKAMAGLSMVGLDGYEKRYPSELSGGQQQRVAVARAVVLEPEVLLFDEPLSNLDAKLRRHVREEIRQIQQELGLTTVYVTHDQEEAMAVSDRIIVMRDGVIEQAGPPAELYELPNSEFIADFIGDANIISCDILSTDRNKASVSLSGITISSAAVKPIDTKVKLIMHPQHISVNRARKENSLPGKVLHAAYLGKHIEYEVDTAVGKIFVVDNRMRDRFDRGDALFIDFNEEKSVLVPA